MRMRNEFPSLTQIQLQWERVGARVPVGIRDLELNREEDMNDALASRLLYTLTGYVMTHRITGDLMRDDAFSVPATWWEHWLKDSRLGRLVARRILRRAPRLTTHHLTSTWDGLVRFPDATVMYPVSLGQPRFALALTSNSWVE